MSIYDFPRQPNYPIDDESLTQSDDDVFEIAQDAVNLAMAVLNIDSERATRLALVVLYRYGDWGNIKLPRELKRMLYVEASGEEEVAAMEEAGEIEY